MSVGVLGAAAPQQYEQLFTSSGTWTKPAGVKTCQIRMIAGAGAPLNNGSSGAGGYWSGIVDVSNLSSVSVTVGAAASSGTGGTTSFGTFYSALGSPAATTGGSAAGGVIDRVYAPGTIYSTNYREIISSASNSDSSAQETKRIGKRIYRMPSGSFNSITYYDIDAEAFVTKSLPATYWTHNAFVNISLANNVWFITGIKSASAGAAIDRLLYSTDGGSTWTAVTIAATYNDSSQYYGSLLYGYYYNAVNYVNGYYVYGRPPTTGGSNAFMYSSTPGGTWAATGPSTANVATYSGAAMFYDSTYSVFVAVVGKATSTSTDDDYELFTSSTINGTYTSAGTVISVGGNNPANIIDKIGSNIYFIGLDTTAGAIKQTKASLASTTTSTVATITHTTSIGTLASTSVPISKMYYDGASLYYGFNGTTIYGVKVDLVAETFTKYTFDISNTSGAGVPTDYTYPNMDTSATTGNYSWLVSSAVTTIAINTVKPAKYWAGNAAVIADGSPGIGGNAFLTNSSTTNYGFGGPGIDGWGIGGTGYSNNLIAGDQNFGSGACSTAKGKDGAVLVRWWK